MLNGYKSYIAATGLLLFAVYGFITGHLTQDVTIPLIFNALAVFGIRNAITNSSNQPLDYKECWVQMWGGKLGH